jgi:hypothetical protein
MAGMKKHQQRKAQTRAKMDTLTIADRDDPDAWGPPVIVAAAKNPKPAWVQQAKRAKSASLVAMEEVESSAVTRIGYNSSSRILHVQFQSGRLYQYFDVPPDIYAELRTASSIGSYFNKVVRDNYQAAEVLLDKKVG